MPTISEVIKLCEGAGLVVRLNPGARGHTKWDVVDPKTDTILTGIANTPGDPNWHWNIRRALRRAGFLINFGGEKTKRTKGISRIPGKRLPAVDLVALKKAQDAAAAAGEHIPTLDDLYEFPHLLSRQKTSPNEAHRPYTEAAQEEAISTMAPKAETPRVNYTRGRLTTFFEKYGDQLSAQARERLIADTGNARGLPEGKGFQTEFVRIALEVVAPQRNLQTWKNLNSGQQALYTFQRGAGLSLWAINLIEATMDHIEGLKWGVDESLKKQEPTATVYPETATATAKTSLTVVESGPITVEPRPQKDGIRERYAEVLLEILKNEGSTTNPEVLDRLDKLAGLV